MIPAPSCGAFRTPPWRGFIKATRFRMCFVTYFFILMMMTVLIASAH